MKLADLGNCKTGYWVGVQTGKKVVAVSPVFTYKQQAEAWNDQQNLPSRALAWTYKEAARSSGPLRSAP